MYNRYQGNSGKVVRVREVHDLAPSRREPRQPGPTANAGHKYPHRTSDSGSNLPVRMPSFIEGGLGRLLSGSLGSLETEDIILLLILYLMYRESGDSELLIMMGAMFLL